ncbi:MAG TPA: DUF3106 domain-containing protein [Luteimonas sp.]|nr:DUF3106 domain-containing protein [Luteimonas sp.]
MRPLRTLLPIVLLLAASATRLHAEPGTQAPGAGLPAWDQLSAQQREMLVAPVRARWDANPDERARLLEHARRWQSMTPEERNRARKGLRRWEGMSPETRQQMRALHGRLRTLPESERTALRERWKTMTPAQRADWANANPAPAESRDHGGKGHR